MTKLMLIGMGSRGDVQPLIVLGEALKEAGYDVVLVAGSNFQAWVEERGLAFLPLTTDMEMLMNSPEGKEWAKNGSKSPIHEGIAMRNMLNAYGQALAEDILRLCTQADVLFSNLPTFGMIEAIAEKYHKPHFRIMFSPLTPTNDPRITMVPSVPWRSVFNRFACYAGIYFTYSITKDVSNLMRQQLGLKAWGWRDYVQAWNRVLSLTGVSPLIMPPDEAWRDNVVVTGYWFDDSGQTWQPPTALTDFLAKGDAPVYIGFGSMTDSDPETTIRHMLNALAETGQRGIIYTGWAGLNASTLPESVFLLQGAPHDWLFPRMKAVVHHGGAGTTGAALRAGVPSTVVSHLGDQPYWGRRIYELGVGAKPMKRSQFNAHRLANAIDAMTKTPDMRQKATQLGELIRAESGTQNAVNVIKGWLL